MTDQKIVITGSTGFLGSNLAKKLTQKNIPFTVFDRKKHNFLKPETLADLLKNADIIFHLAGMIDQTKEAFNFNLNSTNNLLNVASEVAPSCWVIFASSFAVYKLPQKDEIIDEKFGLEPRNNYGLSKLKCEQLLSSTQKIKSVSLRFSNIYGPSPKQIKHSVVSNFINQISAGKTIQITGDGLQERDFLFIDDAVNALIMTAEIKRKLPQVLNICSGEEVSILKLISMIEAVLGKKAKKEFIPAEGHDGYWKSDNSLAKKNLNWRPKIKLKEGLQLTGGSSKTDT